MPPRRIAKGKKMEVEPSRPQKRTILHPNSHDIIFDNPEHERRYSSHVKRKITPTRYLCSDTLAQLGMSEELDRMFHVLGMLEFFHYEAPTFERITLEFFSIVEFKLKKEWAGTTMYYDGTMHFMLYNVDHELTIEHLGDILRLPLYGPGAVTNSFDAKMLWLAIIGRTNYVAKGAKPSGIQNPCFRYAQKVLAFTLFGRGDSTGVATLRELFFLFAMENRVAVSIAAFAVDYLGRVGRVAQGRISIRGIITQIAHHFEYDPGALNETPVSGKNKLDINALVQQGIISQISYYYALMSSNQFIMALPDPARISISKTANWLYESVVHDYMDEHNADTLVAGDQHEEDAQEKDQFVPPQEDTTYTGVRSSSMTPDQWSWIHTKMGDLRADQACQGVEQALQGTVMDEMHTLIQ